MDKVVRLMQPIQPKLTEPEIGERRIEAKKAMIKLVEESTQSLKLGDKITQLSINNHRVVMFLEQNDLAVLGCRLCETFYDESTSEHLQSKQHKKKRDDFAIKEIDDINMSFFKLEAIPGDIEEVLKKDKEN